MLLADDAVIGYRPIINGQLDDLFLFDGAFIYEQHRATVRTTANPVADGRSINDHIIREPFSLNAQAWISDTPFTDSSNGLPQNALQSVVSVVSQTVNSIKSIMTPGNRSVETYLEVASRQGNLMTVYTSLGTYPNMVLTNISSPRTIKNGTEFNLQWKQMLIVNSTDNFTYSGILPITGEKKDSGNKSTYSEATKQEVTNTGVIDGYTEPGIGSSSPNPK